MQASACSPSPFTNTEYATLLFVRYGILWKTPILRIFSYSRARINMSNCQDCYPDSLSVVSINSWNLARKINLLFHIRHNTQSWLEFQPCVSGCFKQWCTLHPSPKEVPFGPSVSTSHGQGIPYSFATTLADVVHRRYHEL